MEATPPHSFNILEPKGFGSETAEHESKLLTMKSPGLLVVSRAFNCNLYPERFYQSKTVFS